MKEYEKLVQQLMDNDVTKTEHIKKQKNLETH